MKAITYKRYGQPNELSLASMPRPTPRKGEVRVKMLACGVNLSDYEYLVGEPFYTRLTGGLMRPKQPILGSDIVGIVDAVGEGVSDLPVGARIMGDLVMKRGGFAEYACVRGTDMALVPDALPTDIAACLPQPGGIAITGMESVKSGQRVLINGAGGGSGTLALQLAILRGAHVTVVDQGDKLDWLLSLGADEAIDFRQQDFAGLGKTWDHILDLVATRGPAKIASALAPGGTYRAVGGNVSILLSLALGGMIYRKEGISIGILAVPTGRALTEQSAKMAIDGILHPHIAGAVSLSETPEALRDVGAGTVRGKLIVRFDE